MNEFDLVNLIYSAVLSDDWHSAALALSKMVGAFSSEMFASDMTAASRGSVASGDRYRQSENLRISGTAASEVEEDAVFDDSPDDAGLHGAVLHGGWSGAGERGEAGGAIVLFNHQRAAAFGDSIRLRDKTRNEQQWLEMLARIGPHLSKALEFRKLFRGKAVHGRPDTLDDRENALLLLDAKGRIQFQNRTATTLFQQQKLARIGAGGILHLLDMYAEATLRGGLSAIVAQDMASVKGAFPIGQSGAQPFIAMLAPFVASRYSTKLSLDLAADAMPVAILAIRRQEPAGRGAGASLSACFGLTAAETELALALRAGVTLKEYAERRAISVHTVRNQLKVIFEKTGVHRQVDLVSLMSRIL